MGRGAEFQALFQRGKRIDRPSLMVLWGPSDGGRRVGFAVSRHVRRAVQRNRARRRLRAAYRAGRETAPARVALVVVGRPRVLEIAFHTLVAEIREALGAIPEPR